MKALILVLTLFSAIALPVFGALTDADLDKIRLIVKEEIKAEIATVRQELKEDIAKSEKNIKEYINLKTDSVEKRLSTYNWVIYILMPLVVAAIGIPTVIMAWRTGKDRSLERKVEMLTEEIETLKGKQIIQP